MQKRGTELDYLSTLVSQPIPSGYAEFMNDHDIRHLQMPVPANKECISMSQKDMNEILDVVLEAANYPLLVHCNKGKVEVPFVNLLKVLMYHVASHGLSRCLSSEETGYGEGRCNR